MTASSKYHMSEAAIATEQEQIKAAQSNARNFEPLYNAYYERILNFVYLRVESKDIAYDVTAQVFVTALENIKRYISKGVPLSAWLFRIAINELNRYVFSLPSERAFSKLSTRTSSNSGSV